jgi:hypothetical protein
VRVAALAAAAVLAAAIVVFLSGSTRRVAWDNGKAPYIGAVVPAGGRLCQGGEYVPDGARRVRFWVDVARGGPLAVSVTDGGSPVTNGRVGGGYRGRVVAVPLATVRGEHVDARICVRNEGATTVSFMGETPAGPETFPPPQPYVRTRAGDPSMLSVHQEYARLYPVVDQPSGAVVVRLQWDLGSSAARWALTPTIAHRAGLNKASFIGSWTFWLLGALMLGVGVAVVRLVVREGSA